MRQIVSRMWKSPAERALLVALALVVVSTIGIGVLLVRSRAQRSFEFCEAQVETRGEACGAGIQLVFDPIIERLGMLQAYGKNGTLELCSDQTLHRVLTPVLESLDVADVAVLANGDDCGTIAQHGEGDWNLAAVAAKPELLAVLRHWLTEPEQDPQTLRWRELDAIANETPPSIAARMAWNGADGGPDAFAAVLLSVDTVRAAMRQWPLGDEGQVMIAGTGRDVVFLSPRLTQGVDIVRRDRLEDRPEFKFGPYSPSLLSPGVPTDMPASKRVRNSDGWAWQSYRTVRLGNTPVVVGYVVPERELISAVDGSATVLFFVLLGMLAGGFVLAFLTARQYRRRVQMLTAGPTYHNADADGLLALIREGEHDRLEFKSTLRWNLKADRADKAMSIAWLKTLAAFMNSSGGTLLVGVQDDGSLLGLEADRFENDDRAMLHFNNMLREHIGLQHAGFIAFALRELEGVRILVVDCARSDLPVFVRDGDDESFYVRVGPGSRKLPASEVLEYVSSR